jgi:hypothetical protein
MRARQWCGRGVCDVFAGPMDAVATGQRFRKQVGWTNGVESVEEANVIDDESIVFRDNCGDDFPSRFIGDEAGKLHVGEIDCHSE